MSTVTPTILSQGESMNPAYGLVSIDIIKEINRIAEARLMLLDGNAALRQFPISDTAFFEPGKEIEIRLRYEGKPDATVFKGLVVRHGVEADGSSSMLVVEMKDSAIKLTLPRKSVVFREKSDNEIMSQIIQDAGLQTGTIASTEPKHLEIVQYYSTDWDFMLSRADIHGLVVVTDDGTISAQKIDLSVQPDHSFEWGMTEIYNFEVQADTTEQHKAIESIAWDVKDQKLTQAAKAEKFVLSQGNLDGEKIAGTIGFGTYTLSHPAPLSPKELKAWADARMIQNRMSMIRGRISVPGFADIKPLDIIEVAGIGERFNGKTVVSGVRHQVNKQGWNTEVQFGLSPDWFCRQENISDVPAAGLLPPVSGLQIGIVDAFDKDPDKEFRIKVILPAIIDGKEGSVWARLLSPDAGEKRGYFFRPEQGDEVVVGFFNNDPRQPVILGAMYGSKNAPPGAFLELTEENTKKGIVTKKGTTIGFDDEKASVFIETPQSNKIVLDDDAKSIQVSDQHGNSLTMDDKGIIIKSAKDFTIDASGNVTIKGQKVDVK